MKNTILYLKLISLKVLQLLKKVAIVLLAIQGIYTAVYAVRDYATMQAIPGIIDVVLLIAYLVGIVILRSCKKILSNCVVVTNREIEHTQQLKIHKEQLIQKKEQALAEQQIKLETIEAEANLFPIRKFEVKKVSKDDLLALDQMIGLDSVKKQLKKMRATINYEKSFSKAKSVSTCHLAFFGKPGTGKTTAAKAVAAFMYDAGIIKEPKYTAVNGNDLLGAYMGQTAPTINALFRQGEGGVIFIDEAYIIANAASDSSGNGYGQECVAQLLTLLEKHEGRTVVILGGYKERMEDFFDMNPGLRSRISVMLDFPDFTPEELLRITEIQLNVAPLKHTLDDNVKPLLLKLFREKIAYCQRFNLPFGNGRYAKNIARELHSQHALNHEEDRSIGTNISIKDLDFQALVNIF